MEILGAQQVFDCSKTRSLGPVEGKSSIPSQKIYSQWMDIYHCSVFAYLLDANLRCYSFPCHLTSEEGENKYLVDLERNDIL